MDVKVYKGLGGQTADGEMSLTEKKMCLMIAGERPELPYPLRDLKCADGTVQKVYDIPDADKEKVFSELWPLVPEPGIDDVMFDLHEKKEFKVRDFIVIRWHGGNLVASPYFAHSGGMAVDFVELAMVGEHTMTVSVDAREVRDFGGKK